MTILYMQIYRLWAMEKYCVEYNGGYSMHYVVFDKDGIVIDKTSIPERAIRLCNHLPNAKKVLVFTEKNEFVVCMLYKNI